MRPRLLDLFCGAGGAAMGYQRAGFEVVGVDVKPQPNYPFEFIQADALTFPLGRFDAIHASPPCQVNVKGMAAVNAALGREMKHADLVAPTRELLVASGLPYVIENVVGADLVNPIQLCGSSFGLAVQRHRLFECSFPVMSMPCAHHLQREAKYPTNWRPNGERRLAKVVQVYGNAAGTHLWPEAMGIDWMTTAEIAQAIPPAYTEHIGAYLLQAVNREGGGVSLRTEVLSRVRSLAGQGRRSVRAWEVASAGEVLSTAAVQAALEALWESGEVDNPGAEMSTFALPRVVGSTAQLTIPGVGG